MKFLREWKFVFRVVEDIIEAVVVSSFGKWKIEIIRFSVGRNMDGGRNGDLYPLGDIVGGF